MPEPLSLTQWEALGEAGQDALVAERVMDLGAPVVLYLWADRKQQKNPLLRFTQGEGLGSYGTFADAHGNKIQYGKPHRVYPCPRYTTSDADACAVLDRMAELGSVWALAWTGEHFRIEIGNRRGMPFKGTGPTRPAAICLAAARAVGAVA